jgi:type IV pilus assembly protein PilC
MPKFEYRARDASGSTLEGLVEADNKEMATETLKDRGLSVLSIDEHKEQMLDFELPFLNGIPTKDIVVFSRQFAVLIGAKVPVVQALKTVSRQTKHPRLTRIVQDISAEVEAGTPLSTAMARHPEAYSSFFVNIIKSGETTGRLEEVMNYLADQMEKDYDLTSRIKGAMTYPVFVIFALVLVGFIMLTFVVPKLTASLTESGTQLPWTTKSLIAVSEFMKNNVIGIVIGVVIAAIIFRIWTSRPDGRLTWDTFKLRLPVFGPLLRYMALVRFTRSMTTLLNGGVDVPSAIEICADIVGNDHYKQVLQETFREVSDGNSITTVFFKDKLIPSMIPQMMTVGEETGRLGPVLEKLTDFYGRELDNSVSGLVSAIEPLIMLVMGGAVGVMVAAIMMPMYQMAMNV